MSNINNIEQDLHDIIRGYSEVETSDGVFYFKHLTTIDVLKLEEVYHKKVLELKKKGLKSRDELLEELVHFGKWTKEDDEFIISSEWNIKELEKAKEKISNFLMKENAQRKIDKEKEELEQRKLKKQELTSFSIENISEQEKVKYLIKNHFFVDKNLTSNIKKIDRDKIPDLFKVFNRFSEENRLIKIAYSPLFFDVFSLYRKQPHKIFNKGGLELTMYQKHILSFASVLLSNLQYHGEEMTEEEKNNAIFVYKFKPKDKEEKSGKKTQGLDDLRNKARSGKKLKPEDYLS